MQPSIHLVLSATLILGTIGFQPLNYRSSIPNKRSIRASPIRPLNALLPLDVDEVERLISTGKPTGDQYAAYVGRTRQEQYNTFFESTNVALLGVFFSYFLSFVIGGFVATILGSLFFFWGVLSPEFKAYQRNWEFLGGRQVVDFDAERPGLYGALFLGRIGDVCVVGRDAEQQQQQEYNLSAFSDYRMEEDELQQYTGQPYLLRVQCTDRNDRSLQIHCRLSEEYLHLVPGMPVCTLLLSTDVEFAELAALTDLYVVDTCWIGDYPYLNRPEVEALLDEDDSIWSALVEEGKPIKSGIARR